MVNQVETCCGVLFTWHWQLQIFFLVNCLNSSSVFCPPKPRTAPVPPVLASTVGPALGEETPSPASAKRDGRASPVTRVSLLPRYIVARVYVRYLNISCIGFVSNRHQRLQPSPLVCWHSYTLNPHHHPYSPHIAPFAWLVQTIAPTSEILTINTEC